MTMKTKQSLDHYPVSRFPGPCWRRLPTGSPLVKCSLSSPLSAPVTVKPNTCLSPHADRDLRGLGDRSTKRREEKVSKMDMDNTSVPSSRTSWSLLKQIRMFFPLGFKTEIKELTKLAGPVVSSAGRCDRGV